MFKNLAKKIFGNPTASVFIAAFLITAFAVTYSQATFIRTLFNVSQTTPSVTSQQTADESLEKVLGESNGSLWLTIPNSYYGYSNGGVLSLSSTQAPKLEINGYGNLPKSVTVSLFKVNKADMLGYLLHDDERKKLALSIDTSSFEKVTEFSENLSNNGTEIALPLEESGVWYVVVKGDDGDLVATSMLVRSSLGALVKEGDNKFVFWTQSFTDLRSESNVQITTYDLTNKLTQLDSQLTNEQGTVELNYTENADVALVEKDGEISLVPINLTAVDTGYWDNRFPAQSIDKKFFVFTDRPIYQPGDTVNFKSIVRNDNDAVYSPASGIAHVVLYKGWNDTVVYEKNFTLSSTGTLDGSFEVPVSSGTGYYRVTVEMGEDYSSYASFSVENYRKPEYSLNVDANETEFIAGDTVSLDVTGTYFSGQPLANQKVTYTIYASNYYQYGYYSEDLPLLSDDYRYGYSYGKKIDSGSVTLNERGLAEIQSKTLNDISENISSDKVYSVEVSFVDETGNPVQARKNVLVHEAEFGIYQKNYSTGVTNGGTINLPIILVPNDPVVSVRNIPIEITPSITQYIREEKNGRSNYRKEHEVLEKINVTTNNSGEATITLPAHRPGSYLFDVRTKDTRGNTVIRTMYAYVYDNDTPYSDLQNGSFDIQLDKESYAPGENATIKIFSAVADRDVFVSVLRDRVRRYQILSITGNSAQFTLPIEESDMPNVYLSTDSFAESHLHNSQKQIKVSTSSKKMNISITPDKPKYGPGDTVTVNIKATDDAQNPISGELAVWAVDKSLYELASDTIGDIFTNFWKERYLSTSDGNSLEGIRSNAAEMGGGCFTGDTPVLMANGSTKAIEMIQVGDTVLTKKFPTDSSLVTAKVIDTTKTKVAGYLILNGTLKVTPEHRLWVHNSWKTADTLSVGDTLLDADGQEVAIESIEWQAGSFDVYNLTIDTYQTYFANNIYVHNQKGDARTTFADTAYWNPVVHTDSNGEAQVTFTLPDNLTTWVITGIGATTSTIVGQSTADIVVGKDIVIRPITPDILREGDSIELSALVHNFTDTEQTLDVSIKSENVRFDSNPLQTVTIAPGDFIQVFWPVTVENENLDNKVTFIADNTQTAELSDAIVQPLPIQAYGFMQKESQTGIGTSTYTVALSENANPGKSSISLNLSPSIVGTLPAAMEYLLDYPYGCVEQTTSRFVPIILATSHPELFGDVLKNTDIADMTEAGLTRLAKLQNDDGGWGWWSGNSDAYISAYVLEYLLLAQSNGIAVDDIMLVNARTFFRNNDSTEIHEIITKQYALALMNERQASELIDVSRLNSLDADYIALAVLANSKNGYSNPETNGLNLLLSLAEKQGDIYSWNTSKQWGFHSSEAATGLALRALQTVGGYQNVVLSSARNMVESRTNAYWGNTYGTVQVIRLITDLSSTLQESNPTYSYTVTLDGKEIASGQVTSSKLNIAPITLESSQIKPEGSTITVTQNGEGQLYSDVLVEDFVTDRTVTAVSNDLSITREYLNVTHPGYAFKVGDVADIRLTVTGLTSTQQYLVVEDHLPAGLIPMNSALKNQKTDGYRQHYFGFYSGGITREFTKDGIIFSLEERYAGNRNASSMTFSYQARVINNGEFSVPPATTALMYVPAINARTGSDQISVTRDPKYIGGERVSGTGPQYVAQNKYLKALATWLRLHPVVAVFIVIALFSGAMVVVVKRQKIKDIVGRLLPIKEQTLPESESDSDQISDE
ncbi:MAG: hypothetical protein CO156_00955 [Candidatus Pacebacteria bacterium CG_4_9_14_3_um_filter_40_12]|nr:MAG: hypothetical protein COY01_05065 [Candidatus Pacebacteria bacterium CG_4_10_14_0_2_um_filter_40_20]PJA69434.1 MAG: hypothetical protein CO156_00955 [Candidatus Pacebacteria bacterium CG_4_9_14_3_um_filter_40_12]PJC41451.1 MAG: hypothetical protein CO041_04940 [Candidatus Pacebacteria bacterium CG_4_9_14_0_2_um_filter_40_15]